MSIPWVPLLKEAGLTASKSPTFNLATVGLSGAPKSRTCVSRGWLFNDEFSGILKYTTDNRMQKVAELKANDQFEACFYYPGTSQQFRIAGFCQILSKSLTPSLNSQQRSDEKPIPKYELLNKSGNPWTPSRQEWDAEYDATWAGMSPSMKESFKKPDPGKKLLKHDKELLKKLAEKTDALTEEDAKNNFLVMLLIPTRVDFVDIRGLGERFLFTLESDGSWKKEETCP